jgi:hypothetical protein
VVGFAVGDMVFTGGVVTTGMVVSVGFEKPGK